MYLFKMNVQKYKIFNQQCKLFKVFYAVNWGLQNFTI